MKFIRSTASTAYLIFSASNLMRHCRASFQTIPGKSARKFMYKKRCAYPQWVVERRNRKRRTKLVIIADFAGGYDHPAVCKST